MKKYILRLIILLAFTGAFYIKIVNQLVFALLALMCLGYLCRNGKVKKRNFVFLSFIFLLVVLGLYNTERPLVKTYQKSPYESSVHVFPSILLPIVDILTNDIPIIAIGIIDI